MLQPCGTIAAYRRHRRKREPACLPCQQARTEASRKRWRTLHGKWQVYVIRFADGMWYYGSTRQKVTARLGPDRKRPELLQRLRAGNHTIEVLTLCDSKELALQMEARFILASDRSKLLNERVPWHFCWEDNPGLRAYEWHRKRNEPPCEGALRGNREYRKEARRRKQQSK